jgi:hypothetical protein
VSCKNSHVFDITFAAAVFRREPAANVVDEVEFYIAGASSKERVGRGFQGW